jgi:hypothetical protein
MISRGNRRIRGKPLLLCSQRKKKGQRGLNECVRVSKRASSNLTYGMFPVYELEKVAKCALQHSQKVSPKTQIVLAYTKFRTPVHHSCTTVISTTLKR